MDVVALQAAKASAKALYPSQRGEKLRRAAIAARFRNSLELPLMASPPTVTTGTTPPDATLTKTYYFTAGAAANFAFRGGTPAVFGGVYYRFPVVTLPTGAGNASATQNAAGWAVEFHSDAPKIQLYMLNAGDTTGWAVEIDGQAISASTIAYPAGSGSGYVLLDFTSAGGRAVRRIRVEGNQASAMRGVMVGTNSQVWAPADTEKITVASVGDSISAMTGATKPNGGWNQSLGKLLGWSDVRQVAIGGSGMVTAANGSTQGDATRVADVQAINPDVVLFMASTNDGGVTSATLRAAALAAFQAHRAACPKAVFIVGGIWAGGSGPNASHLQVEADIKAAFDTWADRNSYYVPIAADPQGSWVTGTSSTTNVGTDGNSSYYIGAAPHPSQEGHDYLAKRWATAIRALVLPAVT